MKTEAGEESGDEGGDVPCVLLLLPLQFHQLGPHRVDVFVHGSKLHVHLTIASKTQVVQFLEFS